MFVAHALTGLFSRTRVPDVLLLTLIGLLLGPIFHLVGPQSFGRRPGICDRRFCLGQ